MTDRNDAYSRNVARLGDTIGWLNVAGITIPAYAVIQLVTDFTSGLSQASMPDSNDGLFYVNGPVDVPTGKRGESYLWNRPRPVLLTGTELVGDEVGPVDSSWSMSRDGRGYRVLHQAVGGVAVVERAGGFSRVQVKMCEDLYAAVDTDTDPSYAQAWVRRRLDNGDLTVTAEVYLITNRFMNISVDRHSYAKAEMIDKEWQLYAADCPAGSSSASDASFTPTPSEGSASDEPPPPPP